MNAFAVTLIWIAGAVASLNMAELGKIKPKPVMYASALVISLVWPLIIWVGIIKGLYAVVFK